MPLHRPQNRSTVDIKHLHNPLISTRNDQLSILSNLCAPRRLLEPGDRLDHLSRPWCVDQ